MRGQKHAQRLECGELARPLARSDLSLKSRRIPTGFRPEAQGCERRATVGGNANAKYNPEGVAARSARNNRTGRNPVGVGDSGRGGPRVARSSQPWAEGHNPVGIANPGTELELSPAFEPVAVRQRQQAASTPNAARLPPRCRRPQPVPKPGRRTFEDGNGIEDEEDGMAVLGDWQQGIRALADGGREAAGARPPPAACSTTSATGRRRCPCSTR